MRILIPILLLFLSSCAGYQFSRSTNPFEIQGVSSVTVFMVKNHTAINDLSRLYTTEITETLSSFSGLRVRTGKNFSSDAILIAEITSIREAGKEVEEGGETLMNEQQQNAIGERNPFLLSTSADYEFEVSINVFKKPNVDEIKFYESFYKLDYDSFPRSIFSKKFIISKTYVIENTVGGVDTAGPLRSVKNRGTFNKSLEDAADSFGDDFREVLLYAF